MKPSRFPPFIIASVLCLLCSVLLAQDDPTAGATVPPTEIDAATFENLQAAIDALPVSGGIVRLPAGTFEITKPLVISTPETRLEGAGPSTHIKNVNTTGEPAFVLSPADRTKNSKARLWRIQLGNFRISGNEKSGDGVHAEAIDEILLHGLSVDHHGGNGVTLMDCYEDARIADSIFTYNKKSGVQIHAGHDIVVNGNQFEENQDALRCIDSYNLCMNGNNIDDHLGNGVVIENTYGSVLSGNMIEECNGTAIILDGDCYGITLSANVIAHHLEGGIDLRDAHGCAVSANTFTLVHEFSVRVSAESGRIAITGNSFCNSHIGEGKEKRLPEHKNPMQIDMGTGVRIEGGSHVNVSGNTFTGITGSAVFADEKASKNMIQGNLITDWGRNTTREIPAIAVPAENGNVIVGNLVD